MEILLYYVKRIFKKFKKCSYRFSSLYTYRIDMKSVDRYVRFLLKIQLFPQLYKELKIPRSLILSTNMQCSRIIIVAVTWKKGNNFFRKRRKKVKRNALLFQKIGHFILCSTLGFRTENLLSSHVFQLSLSSLGIFVGNCLVQISSTS